MKTIRHCKKPTGTSRQANLNAVLIFLFGFYRFDLILRIFGGLAEDIKRKAKWYLSDFKDGFNFQCISSIGFMYFACLAPIIAFGGLLDLATDKSMVGAI
jgi:hypothetical protein